MNEICHWCNGRRGYYGSDEWHPCPRCQNRRLDAEERAAEEWKALRDSGADELTLRAMSGDR